LPENPVAAVSQILPKGVVRIPMEVKEKPDLKLGTNLVVVVAEDAEVLRKVGAIFAKNRPRGVVNSLRSMRLTQRAAKKPEARSSGEVSKKTQCESGRTSALERCSLQGAVIHQVR
jgi:bifunctional DNA-binding transcriptional regulator/antitoxin component of YhaV-PrlF toxin-antitoxin module